MNHWVRQTNLVILNLEDPECGYDQFQALEGRGGEYCWPTAVLGVFRHLVWGRPQNQGSRGSLPKTNKDERNLACLMCLPVDFWAWERSQDWIQWGHNASWVSDSDIHLLNIQMFNCTPVICSSDMEACLGDVCHRWLWAVPGVEHWVLITSP